MPAAPVAPSLPAGTTTTSERPLTAGPAARTQPALQNGVVHSTSGISQNTAAQSGLQSAAEADPVPWRARTAWLQAQTTGDPAAELYRSNIPLGRAAGMGGVGPDCSAYQEAYGQDPAGLAKSTAKEAVARKAQVSPDHLAKFQLNDASSVGLYVPLKYQRSACQMQIGRRQASFMQRTLVKIRQAALACSCYLCMALIACHTDWQSN